MIVATLLALVGSAQWQTGKPDTGPLSAAIGSYEACVLFEAAQRASKTADDIATIKRASFEACRSKRERIADHWPTTKADFDREIASFEADEARKITSMIVEARSRF